MTSVDSGVESESNSNDSLATHDSQSMDLSPPVKASPGVESGEQQSSSSKEEASSSSSNVELAACDMGACSSASPDHIEPTAPPQPAAAETRLASHPSSSREQQAMASTSVAETCVDCRQQESCLLGFSSLPAQDFSFPAASNKFLLPKAPSYNPNPEKWMAHTACNPFDPENLKKTFAPWPEMTSFISTSVPPDADLFHQFLRSRLNSASNDDRHSPTDTKSSVSTTTSQSDGQEASSISTNTQLQQLDEPAIPPRRESLEIEPPAGLSFLNIIQNTSGGYEIINQDFNCSSNQHKTKTTFKMRKRFTLSSKLARVNQYEPIGRHNERKLRRASSTNNREQVEFLLNQEVNPNSCDDLGRSPLHLAASRGYDEIVQLLLQKGADPNQKDSQGNTPLHLAACTSHVSVITLLLKAGTDVHSSDHFGRNPLQLAQTRLRLLQRNAHAASNPDAWRVKTEVKQVVEMMLAYLHRFRSTEADAEMLSSFCSRLSLSQTTQEVDQELRGLLASLSNLAIEKPS